MAEKTSEGFQDAAVQILVILFVKDVEEVVNAQHYSNDLFGITSKIGHQPVVLQVVGNEDVHAKNSKRIDPCQEIRIIDRPGCQQIGHRDFRQHNDLRILSLRLGKKLLQRALKHVFIDK